MIPRQSPDDLLGQCRRILNNSMSDSLLEYEALAVTGNLDIGRKITDDSMF